MNKPIDIQPFVCEVSKCPDVQRLKKALEEIKEIANEPCIDDEDCETCDSNCMSKEILDKINEVLKDEQ